MKGTINNIKVSRLHLVDLAGSERQKDTQTEGLRLKVCAVSAVLETVDWTRKKLSRFRPG